MKIFNKFPLRVKDGGDDGWSDEGYYEGMRMDMMNMK
jgi:hypothetical protein